MISLSKMFHALRPSHAPRPFRSLALQQPSPSAPPPISHVLIIIGNVRSTKISGRVVVIIIVIVIIIIIIIIVVLCNNDNKITIMTIVMNMTIVLIMMNLMMVTDSNNHYI